VLSTKRRIGGRAGELADNFRYFGEPSEIRRAYRFSRQRRVGPLSYAAAKRAHLELLPRSVDPTAGVVVDAGANDGEWTAALLKVFPGTEVIAVEPGEEPLANLHSCFEKAENVRIVPKALARDPGLSQYHRTRASVFASLLPPERALHDLYSLPGSPTTVLEVVPVETVTLDEVVGDRAVSILKLDVQGGELGVLEGGRQTLSRTAAVLVEVLYLPHYRGDTTFPMLHEAMSELGFQLMNVSSPFRIDDGPALWADACYCPRRADGRGRPGVASHG
jgi:FkbM family methyltransferase